MKTILLCMCMLFVIIGVFSLNSVVASADALPTTAPAEETIISQDDVYATQTARPTYVYPTSESYPAPSEDLYPAPEEPQYMTMQEFSDLIISIFGKITYGKNVQHK